MYFHVSLDYDSLHAPAHKKTSRSLALTAKLLDVQMQISPGCRQVRPAKTILWPLPHSAFQCDRLACHILKVRGSELNTYSSDLQL